MWVVQQVCREAERALASLPRWADHVLPWPMIHRLLLRGHRMDIEHNNWHILRLPHTLSVTGRVTQRTTRDRDGVWWVPTRARLAQSAVRTSDSTILVLDLSVESPRHDPPYTPPSDRTTCQATYHKEPAGPAEAAYTHVHVFYEGRCIQELRVPPF